MSRLLILVLLLFFCFSDLYAQFWYDGQKVLLSGNICSNEDWKLVFHDEFDGSTLDNSKWYRYFPDWPNNTDDSFFSRTHCTTDDPNRELQAYIDNNVVVENGILNLRIKNELYTWKGFEKNIRRA